MLLLWILAQFSGDMPSIFQHSHMEQGQNRIHSGPGFRSKGSFCMEGKRVADHIGSDSRAGGMVIARWKIA